MGKINGLTLGQFTKAVDSICEKQYGVIVDDIMGDWPRADLWADELTPADAFADISDTIQNCARSMGWGQ